MIIGLTASIACGKSTVSDYLVKKGYKVIDADKISRSALDIGTSAYKQVAMHFDCLNEDGSIDRKKLGSIIFNDEKEKEVLESYTHPYIIETIQKEISLSKGIIFLDIPLLYELHLEYLCDLIVVVYCNESLQLERLMQRNHYNKEEALLRIHSQISIEEKRLKADYVIDNNGDLSYLYEEIERMLESEIIHQ